MPDIETVMRIRGGGLDLDALLPGRSERGTVCAAWRLGAVERAVESVSAKAMQTGQGCLPWWPKVGRLQAFAGFGAEFWCVVIVVAARQGVGFVPAVFVDKDRRSQRGG